MTMEVIAFSEAHCAVRFNLERSDHAAWVTKHYPETPSIEAIKSWAQGIALPEPKLNRAARRALAVTERQALRARLKFDKLVTPKGPKPVKQARSAIPKLAPTSKPEPEPAPEAPPRSVVIDHYDLNPEHPKVVYERSEFKGQFNFRDTILDQLERYWFYLNRMRHYDSDAFGFYKQVGMHMVPHAATGAMGKSDDLPDGSSLKVSPLPPLFKAKRPSFGCVAYGANTKIEEWEDGTKHIWPRFLYYTKFTEPPPEVQRLNVGGDIYKMTIWWDTNKDPKHYKWGVPNDFSVLIDKAGDKIIVLKTCKTRMVPVRRKHSLAKFRIPDRSWRIPHDYERWANRHGLDVQTHLSGLFVTAARLVEKSQAGDVRVAVHKDDLTAVFNIDAQRMAYFFQDRDYNLTESGTRKKVFHIVQAHTRADGTEVKTHYRGEKKFTWADYEIEVTVPGLDHFAEHEFTIGAVDDYWVDKKDRKKMIYGPELGTQLVQYMKDGVGGRNERT